MGFKVISSMENEMHPGQIIEYKVSPLFGIPMYWMTEITHVDFQKFFVDEQRVGPYQFWHHQHHFRVLANGVEMTDIVHYRIPLGILGDIANRVLVHARLRDIFDHRYRVCAERFK
jgi:ligand-binding SRPBCC domain-containing protein